MKNPLALGLVLLGALGLVVATFLPLNESGGFGDVKDNTLIQHRGWMLIVLALWIGVGGYLVDQERSPRAFIVVPCFIAACFVFEYGVSEELQTLYPVGADGTLDESGPGVRVNPGIGVYLAGVAVAVAFAGAMMLRGSRVDGRRRGRHERDKH